MEYIVRFAQPFVLLFFVSFVIGAIVLRIWWYKPPTYIYSLVSALRARGATYTHWATRFFFVLRVLVLIVLALLVARPQRGDTSSQVSINGIDIVLVLDVSGSMRFQDFEDDDRSRIDVAKAEAIRFIDKRDNDAIGLVIFGNDALSRCPLTLDKPMLRSIVNELHLGIIDPEGTLLVRGIIAGANRLKQASAKSKVMIVLTDGEPSENDMDPSVAIEIAQKLGIRIYTIGIGSEEHRLMVHPFYGRVPLPSINKELLTSIASQTGGQYFLARNAADMRRIYDDIDRLETTDHDALVFTNWYDVYLPFVLGIFLILLCELVCTLFVWRML